MKNFLKRVKENRASYYDFIETKLIESSVIEYLDQKDDWLSIGVGGVIIVTIATVIYVPIYLMSICKALFNK